MPTSFFERKKEKKSIPFSQKNKIVKIANLVWAILYCMFLIIPTIIIFPFMLFIAVVAVIKDVIFPSDAPHY